MKRKSTAEHANGPNHPPTTSQDDFGNINKPEFDKDFVPFLEFLGNLGSISQACSNFSLHDPFLNLVQESKKSNILDTMYSFINKGGKYGEEQVSLSKRGKYVVEAIWTAVRRIVSFFDMYTDCYLLYLVHIYTNPSQSELLPFGAMLCISIICPYIVSYSCGIRLITMNHLYKQYVGLQKVLLYIGLSPIGISYFILLDLIDMIFSCYKLIVIVLFGKTDIQMKLLEETVANQLGMTRMEYEGIKRQRGVTMLMFETVPQVTIQLMLLLGVFGAANSRVLEEAGINASSVYPSLCSALLNSIFQIARLNLEAKAVYESFQKYCLECFMARISWIPFKDQIKCFLAGNLHPKSIVDDMSGNDTFKICYNIKYKLPLLGDDGYEPKVGFDFSSSTVHQLIATMDLASGERNFSCNKNHKTTHVQTGKKNSNNDKKRKDNEIKVNSNGNLVVPEQLEIDFGKSLRLINFGDLMNLLEACSNHNILISSTDSNKLFGLISHSVDISRNGGDHDVTNGKSKSGKPFTSSLYSLCSKNALFGDEFSDELKSAVLECMIWKGFDLNGIDNASGETILFDLIRANDIDALSLVLEKYVKEKRNRLLVNYHNNDGMSPLCVAIRDFIKRKKIGNNINGDNGKQVVRHIYQMLIDNDIENACLNFPAFGYDVSQGIRSILGYVLYREEWQLGLELFKKGAVLDSRETFILIKSFVTTAYDDENNYEHLKIINKIACASCHDFLPHLSAFNGNNPIHKFILDLDKNHGFGIEGHKAAVGKLINLCPEWVLAQNKKNKTAFEILLRSLYVQRNDEYQIDSMHVSLFDEMMQHLSQASEIIFENLRKHRLNEHKTCILHLKMLTVLDGIKTNKMNDSGKDTGVSVIARLVRLFGDTIGNDGSIKWVDVIETVGKTQKNVDVELMKQFIFDNFGFEFAPQVEKISGIIETSLNLPKIINESQIESQVESNDESKDESKDDYKDTPKADVKLDVIEQLQLQEHEDFSKFNEFKQVDNDEEDAITWFEWIYVFAVESLSCADLITDTIILSQLANGHMWWTTLSILFIISPYLVSYTAMGTLLQRKFKSSILSVVAMTPLCTIYFLLLDVIFMIYAIIHSLVFLVSGSRKNIGNWMEDKFFRKYLRVGRMELIGYRRLRTFSQLIFETVPSIVLQIRILVVLGNNGNDINVSYENLVYSIGFALLHTLLEGSILYLDSQACHLSIEEYAIICLNARLSWVPFSNILSSKSTKFRSTVMVGEYEAKNGAEDSLSQYTSLDFEAITSKLCSIKYKLDFEFGKDSWQVLIHYINDIDPYCPKFIQQHSEQDEANLTNAMAIDTNVTQLLIPLFAESINGGGMWFDSSSDVLSHNRMLDVIPHILEIKFGKHCCKNIDLFDFRDVLRVGSNKLLIDCQDMDWKRLIKITQRAEATSMKIDYVLNDIVNYLLKMGDFEAVVQLLKAIELNEGINHDNGILNNISDKFNVLKLQILRNARFNMLPLKKCYDRGIMFGTNCMESNQLYSIVYQLIRKHIESSFNSDSWEDGAKFYVAMLYLWYTQGTITKHHCYECDRDWINHVASFETEFKNGIENDNSGINSSKDSSNTHTRTAYAINAPAFNDYSIRQQINAFIDLHLKPTITMEMEKNNSNNTAKKIDISWNALHFFATTKLNQLISNHLFSKAYAYLFIATSEGIGQNENTNSKHNGLQYFKTHEIKRNDCKLVRNDSKKLNNVTNMNDDLEYLNKMGTSINIIDKHLQGDSDSIILSNLGETQIQSAQLNCEDSNNFVFGLDFGSFIHDSDDNGVLTTVEEIDVIVSVNDGSDPKKMVKCDLLLPANSADVIEENSMIYNEFPLAFVNSVESEVKQDIQDGGQVNQIKYAVKFIYSIKYDITCGKLRITFDEAPTMNKVDVIIHWRRTDLDRAMKFVVDSQKEIEDRDANDNYQGYNEMNSLYLDKKQTSSKRKSTLSEIGTQNSDITLYPSEWHEQDIKYIENPLVIIIGCGDYDNNVMPSLIGVKTDYKRIINAFYKIFKYSIVYKCTNDETVYLTSNNKWKNKNDYKLYWTFEDIQDFIEESRDKYFVSNKHDSLILIISSHGEEEVMLTSDGDEYEHLGFVQAFGDKQHNGLFTNIPKISIFDMCRGNMKPMIPKKNASSSTALSIKKQTSIESVSDDNDFHLWRRIYANPNGYAAIDGGNKGGYLIRGLCTTLLDKNNVIAHDLDEIINQIRIKTKLLAGNYMTEIVEDVNDIHYKIYLKIKTN